MSRTAIALNRFGLGARLEDRPPDNPERWLLGQFDRYEPAPEPIRAAPDRLAVARSLDEGYTALARIRRQERNGGAMAASPGGENSTSTNVRDPREVRREMRRETRNFHQEAIGARTIAALTTPTPFVERLVHFWANHFAVSAEKQTMTSFAGLLEFEAVRPHVLGRFEDLLVAVERHPAMLIYLDQARSIGPGSPAGRRSRNRGNGRERGLNENLAREILELHTLGVDGGYYQADIVEFAKALTGWSVAGLGNRSPGARISGDARPGDFVFAAPWHEPGTRQVLGRSYDDRGEGQAAAILADLARHPATARHLARKLARHFAGDEPPQPLVDRLAAAYRESDGELAAVYRALIASPEPWLDQPVKFRSPWDWHIAAQRAVGAQQLDGQAAAKTLEQLGQPVWQPGSPAGFDDRSAHWAGPDALVRRVELAGQIARRAGDRIDPRALALRLFPGQLSETTAQSIARAESESQGLALLLVSPEFQRR